MIFNDINHFNFKNNYFSIEIFLHTLRYYYVKFSNGRKDFKIKFKIFPEIKNREQNKTVRIKYDCLNFQYPHQGFNKQNILKLVTLYISKEKQSKFDKSSKIKSSKNIPKLLSVHILNIPKSSPKHPSNIGRKSSKKYSVLTTYK